MFSKIIALSIIVLGGIFLSPAFADDAKLPRTLSLSGHGEVRLAPDMAVVTVGAMSSAATAREALDANTKAMESIIASLTTAKIEMRDIQTSNFGVNPRYDYGQGGNQPPKVLGYDVSNNVNVTVRKLDTLGAVLDAVVSAGSNQINGVMFQLAKPGAATDEARKLAVADARHKANIYAGGQRRHTWKHSLDFRRRRLPATRPNVQDHALRGHASGCAHSPGRAGHRCGREYYLGNQLEVIAPAIACQSGSARYHPCPYASETLGGTNSSRMFNVLPTS